MSRPKSNARDRLLKATMDYAWKHGVGEASLREVASAIGTSHRMLIYHFGSKEGLLVEVVRALERQQQQILDASIHADETLTPAEFLRKVWQYVTGPSTAAYVRLFFEVYGQALQGRAHTAEFLVGTIDAWLEPFTKVILRAGVPARRARDDARLALAVTRGLLLDYMATENKAATTRAHERYLELYSAALGISNTKPARRSPQARS